MQLVTAMVLLHVTAPRLNPTGLFRVVKEKCGPKFLDCTLITLIKKKKKKDILLAVT